jgi:hypothetical protein
MSLSIKLVVIGDKVFGKDIHIRKTLNNGVDETGIPVVLDPTDGRRIHV